jgi:Bacterial PH domain
VGKVFYSKVDEWLIIVSIFFVIVSVASLFIIIERSQNILLTILVSFLLIAVGVILPFWLLNTFYKINEDILAVKCGPFNWNIKLAEIKSITPTKDLISSPAFSVDRLRIEYGKSNFIIVSPKNKSDFIKEIEKCKENLYTA